MKKVLVVLASLTLVAASALAQNASDLNPKAGHHATNEANGNNGNGNGNGNNGNDNPSNKATSGGSGNLINHGGGVMNGGKVICIFWGYTKMSSSYYQNAQSFRNSGIVPHTGMLAQYGVTAGNPFGGTDLFDSSNPSSTRVTDAMVQAEVAKMAGFYANTNTIYEVFIPSGYYSDDGSGATSCGGPNLQYCAYHSSGDGSHLATNVKYSIEPYPGCSGCAASGWSTNQNANHFMIHETREALTDPYGSSWYDSVGYEADDKCAWTGLFISNGYGYQPEYSNSARNCVQ